VKRLIKATRNLRRYEERAESEDFLQKFIEYGWENLDPAEFTKGKHIDRICNYLRAVSDGEVRRLIINVPPRHMKSLSVAVAWPAWEWIKRPERKFLFSSYSQPLSTRDSRKCRNLIESNWYQRNWGDRFELSGDQNQKIRFENDKQGYRVATSVGGAMTGEGGDFVIVDDPLNSIDRNSKPALQKTIDWWDEAMSTRLNNPKTGAYIIIMQRLHQNDLVGHILAKEHNYDLLCLPAEYEGNRCIVQSGLDTEKYQIDDWRTEDGQLLWPERYSAAELADLKNSLGSVGASAQLQQRPAVSGGSLFKAEWWKRYTMLPNITKRVIYADTAQKISEKNDYSVFQCWGYSPGLGIFLLDQIRGKWKSLELEQKAKDFWRKHRKREHGLPPVSLMKVEDKASGISLIQQLEIDLSVNVKPIPRNRDKVSRANDVTAKIELGQVWIPAGETPLTDASWLSDYIDEFSNFNELMTHSHDDQIDPTIDAIDDLLMGNEKTNPVAGLYGRR
jgi:predicted phage terminase large subunit-like protein